MAAPLLVFAVGNESRGDDALAPLLVRQLQAEGISDHVEVIEDYQLQVEHATDLFGRKAVLFVDADMACDAPYHLSKITAARDDSYTSHAMTPSALLHTYRQVYGSEAPASFLLRIRGYGFELGERLSDEAASNLARAKESLRDWLVKMKAIC